MKKYKSEHAPEQQKLGRMIAVSKSGTEHIWYKSIDKQTKSTDKQTDALQRDMKKI